MDIEWIAHLATSFPGVTEGIHWGNRTWQVAGKSVVWERAFSKADIKRFGDARIPDEPIIAIRTEDLHHKEAILASRPAGGGGTARWDAQVAQRGIDIEHFKNHPAYLVELALAREEQVRELVTDGWLAVARPDLAREFLA